MSVEDVESVLDLHCQKLAAVALEREVILLLEVCNGLLAVARDAADRLDPFDGVRSTELRRRAWEATAPLRAAGHALGDPDAGGRS